MPTLYPKRGAETEGAAKSFLTAIYLKKQPITEEKLSHNIEEITPFEQFMGTTEILQLSQEEKESLFTWEMPYYQRLDKLLKEAGVEIKVYPKRVSKGGDTSREVKANLSSWKTPEIKRLIDKIKNKKVTFADIDAVFAEKTFAYDMNAEEIEQNVRQIYIIKNFLKDLESSSDKKSAWPQNNVKLLTACIKKMETLQDSYEKDTRKALESQLLGELLPRIAEDGRLDITDIQHPTRLSFVMNRNEIETALSDLYVLKSDLQNELIALNNATTPLEIAQCMMAIFYLKKVNSHIAATKQTGLHKDFPSEHRKQRHAERMTKFIYGASSELLENRERSVIPKVVQKQVQEQTETILSTAAFQDANIRKLGLDPAKVLDTTPGSPYTFTSEQAREIAEDALNEYGILSSEPHTTYRKERKGPAKDGKWQAIIDPNVTTFMVNGTQKVVKIPPNKTYHIHNIISVLIGHEIEGHVLQWVNKEHMPLQLFQKGGDRAMLWAEMGAMYNQDIVGRECFGIASPAQPDYIPAMQVKERGGNYLDVVKTMFDFHRDAIALMPSEEERSRERKKFLTRAINRSFRLFNGTDEFAKRGTGVTHTKDTVYLEQVAVMDILKETGMENLAFLGGMNLDNIAALIKIGFMDKDKVIGPKRIAQKIWTMHKPKYLLENTAA